MVDGNNRRIAKRTNGVLQKGWLYQNGLNPVAELDNQNRVIAQFIYAEKGNVPSSMIRTAYASTTDTTGTNTTYRIISDHLGSVRVVVDSATGTVAQIMNYNPWGKVTQDTNPGFQPFGYAGGLYDSDTGLVRFGARDYDPEFGRWTAKDPIQFSGGDVNLYGYVRGNPVSRIDPFGMAVGDWWDFPANFNRAQDIANEELDNYPGHNDCGDAMRHAQWNQRMTEELGSGNAFIAGWGREITGFLVGQPLSEMNMDLHNNAVGRNSAGKPIDPSYLRTISDPKKGNLGCGCGMKGGGGHGATGSW